ncbi:hypothetical protein CAI21_14445 [Alkalilimnicola ehrlichii]|uniref:Cytochrome c domain-containing protein n=1 Tax=Alkalilimnicola ehrlichii TaxID=351052 RepID=A0A3E0WKR2_9GAMM|nr:cytochrome c [Alkalilimnicola ehrlichii]RFA27805.1 hypothetical protein CAI21_14445 [Alkalilimnicola ehrlichii]RFA33550.1 hypothetical protein CAL65_16980 [Alkalilimnicola ehrlichii]
MAAVVVAALLLCVAPVTGAEPTANPSQASPTKASFSSSSQLSVNQRMAINMRQGVCRTMAHHLVVLSDAADESEALPALQAIAQLAGGMLNGYSLRGEFEESRASEQIWSNGGGEFRQQRQEFMETVRGSRANWEPTAYRRIADSCAACHAAFTTETPWPRLGEPINNTY